MDPRWLPWCWAAGAVGCALVFLVVQPWRQEWAAGARLVRKYPAAWLLPAGLWLIDWIFTGFTERCWMLEMPQGSLPPLPAVALALAETLHGPAFGAGTAWTGALLLAVNAGGMRRGFFKGVESVTGKRGFAVFAVLLVGAAALAADVALGGHGVPAVWHWAVRTLAVPLVGWASATVLAGWLLLAETSVRAPEKVAEVRWLESAAAHSVRLWPWALGHGLIWWLSFGLPGWATEYAGEVLAAAALVLAFAPLVFLHVKRLAEVKAGAGAALRFWRSHGWQPLAWLAVAALPFYAWHLAGQGMAHATADQAAALRIGLATLHGIVHIGLTVMSLGAWVGFRLADAPSSPRPRRLRS